jgi:hypothetical protein
MPHFKCLACKTRLHGTDGQADPIGDLCPVCGSLLEPVGDLGEIVGYRLIESRGSTSHRGASGAGQVIADRVGEIIARRELGHARVRLEIESYDAHSVSPQVQAVSSRAPGKGDEAVRRRRRTPTTAAPTRVPRVLGAFDDGRHRRERARRKSRFVLGLVFGWRAAKWDRPRATKKTPPSVAARERHGRRVPGRQATQRRRPI